jgi:hypothetical protein
MQFNCYITFSYIACRIYYISGVPREGRGEMLLNNEVMIE